MTNYREIEFSQIAADWDSALLGREGEPPLLLIRNGLTIDQNKDQGDFRVTRIETISDGYIAEDKVRYASGLSSEQVEISHSDGRHSVQPYQQRCASRKNSHCLEGLYRSIARNESIAFAGEQKNSRPEFPTLLVLLHRAKGVFVKICSRSVNQSSINQAKLKALEIPLPPLLEQRNIAAVLGLVQRAIEQQERLIMLTTELKKALLHKVFTEGLRGEPQKQTEIGPVPESWEIVRLGEICTLGTGTTPSTARPEYYNGDVPFVKTADIANNRINISQTNVSNEAVKDCGLKLYPPGTVLMAMYGQGKTRGQVSLLEISAATSQNAAAIQPSTEINSEFLWQYLTSRYQVLRGSGALGHISHLNLGYVRDFQIPKPSIVIQREIAEILRTIDSRLTLIESRKRLLDDLFRTLLHQLMTAQIRVHDLDPSALPVYPRNLPHE